MEARMLARILRDTLGESDLLLAPAKASSDSGKGAAESARKPVAKRVSKESTAPQSAASSPVAVQAKRDSSGTASKSGNGDPFGALK